MPSFCAAARACGIARGDRRDFRVGPLPCCIAGLTFSVAILATPITPHLTLRMVPLLMKSPPGCGRRKMLTPSSPAHGLPPAAPASSPEILERARLVEFRDLFRLELKFGRCEVLPDIEPPRRRRSSPLCAAAARRARRAPREEIRGLCDRRCRRRRSALLVDLGREIKHRATRSPLSPRLSRVYLPENMHCSGLHTITPRPDPRPPARSRARVHVRRSKYRPRSRKRAAAFVGNADRLHDLPGGEVRAADRATEPRLTQSSSARKVSERRYGVESVDLIEIHMIEPEPLQAGGNLIHDMAAREAHRIGPTAGNFWLRR